MSSGWWITWLWGEARHRKAGQLEVHVLSAVAFEGSPHRVERVAVHLDHPPLLAPQEVDLVAVQPRVHLRIGQAAAAAQSEECLLELAAGEGWGAAFLGEQPLERCGSAAGGSLQGFLDRFGATNCST